MAWEVVIGINNFEILVKERDVIVKLVLVHTYLLNDSDTKIVILKLYSSSDSNQLNSSASDSFILGTLKYLIYMQIMTRRD